MIYQEWSLMLRTGAIAEKFVEGIQSSGENIKYLEMLQVR